MPRELPGFYWDEEKNRYFPNSFKPKSKNDTQVANSQRSIKPLPTNSEGPSVETDGRAKPRHRYTHYRATQAVRLSVRSADKDRAVHELLCSQIASTSKVTQQDVSLLPGATISAFKTTSFDGRTLSFFGDSRGWFFSWNADEFDENGDLAFQIPRGWTPEFFLPSRLSSISISGSRCAATSFGPSCKILLQALDTSNVHIIKPGDHIVHDIWTSSLRGSELVLGANKQAVVFPTIDNPRTMHFLKTQSDVFAVEQTENLVYTGSRNGVIYRFDLRTSESNGQRLLDDNFLSSKNSTINLRIVRDWQLLVGNIDGSLATYDLRYPRGSTPLMTFTGNVNSWTIQTALDVDPSEQFMFASGQDARIRAWSMRTGELIRPSASPVRSITNPFETPFSDPIQALQVVEEKEGMCLWAASGQQLCKYHLGQHGVF